jgi:hypothetical protein
MFKRRIWPLVLLSILSFGGFAAFVWMKPLGDPFVESFSQRSSTRPTEATNQDDLMVRATPEESSAPEETSGTSRPVFFKPTSSVNKGTADGAGPPLSSTSFFSVGPTTSTNHGGVPSVPQSSMVTSGAAYGSSNPSETTPMPTVELINNDDDDDDNGRRLVPAPTGEKVPVPVPQPVGFPPPATQSPTDPEPEVEPEVGCTCSNPW